MRMKNAPVDYLERVQRVNAYVFDHLYEDLNFRKIAEVACLSEYHWHRIYRAVTGETIHSLIKRLRMEYAAKDLIETKLSIEKIGRKAGFQDKNSFSRAFSKSFMLPPLAYRKRGQLLLLQIKTQDVDQNMFNVTIKEIPAITVAAVSHKGAYMDIGKAYDILMGWAMKNDRFTDQTRVIGIAYDNPDVVPEKDLRSEACISMEHSFQGDGDVKRIIIPAGTYAMLEFKGPYAELHVAYNWFYGAWLQDNDVEMVDHYGFEEYLNNARDVPPTELLTNIYMPLK